MSEFDKPIGRAFRRMRMQRFLAALVWCVGAGLLVVAASIAYEKIADRALPGADWIPFAIAGGAGVVLAALIAVFSGPSRVDAAVAIDRLFGLNDRLATTLTLPEDLRDTPAGRALIADTKAHIGSLDIGSRFGLVMPRRAWVPLVPAALAVGLLFIPKWVETQAGLVKREDQMIDKEVAKKQMQTVAKSIAERKKEAAAQQLSQETQKILAEVQKAAEKLAKTPPAEKDKAMVEMNKLQNLLKDRQKQVGSAEQIAKQLQQMKEMASNGPADEFAKDMAKGDFQKAAQELKQLAQKLKDGKLSETDKKKMMDQLSQMQKQMDKLANMEKRKQQIEEAVKSGAMTKQEAQKQLDKIAEQAKQLQKMAQMAQQLQKASDAMAKGDMKKAADALGMTEQQLQDLAKQAQELESLDAAMADLQDAKNGMANDGMNQLGQQMDGMNSMGQGNRPGNNGNGLGRGRGQGDRPEAEDAVSAYNTKTKGQMGKGKAVIEGTAPPSKQMKGESLIEIQETVEASAAEQAEALSGQKIPKSIKKHAIGYFDKIRKGE